MDTIVYPGMNVHKERYTLCFYNYDTYYLRLTVVDIIFLIF